MTDQEQEYFEKLINAQFEHMRSDIRDLKEDVTKILSQTTITNGRVTALEKWQSGVQAADQQNEKHNGSNAWIISLVVTIVLTVGTTLATAWATKLWH